MCPGNEPAFLVLCYLEALQSSFLPWGLWECDLVSYGESGVVQAGCVAGARCERFANFCSKLSARSGSLPLPCCRHRSVLRGILFACCSAYRNKGRWGSAEQSVLDGEGRSGCLQVHIYRWTGGQVEKYVGVYFGYGLTFPLHV